MPSIRDSEKRKIRLHYCELKPYLVRVPDATKTIVTKATKIQTTIVLFAVCILADLALLFASTALGLSDLFKGILVATIPLVIIVTGILAFFKPDSLLMSADQKIEMAKVLLGDSGMKREYVLGEIMDQTKRLEITHDERPEE